MKEISGIVGGVQYSSLALSADVTEGGSIFGTHVSTRK